MISEAISLKPSAVNRGVRILLASFMLILFSSVKIPFSPIPFTLQTLALWLIAFELKPLDAATSTLLYLVYATLGLPVLCGWVSNPLWFTGPTAGYLWAFPLAVPVLSFVLRKSQSDIGVGFGLLLANAIIFSFGAAHLSMFLGVFKAVQFGVLPFIGPAIIKAIIALSYRKHSAIFKNFG